MSRPNYDFIVLIGRFQPIHYGHVDQLRAALGRADQLLLLVGSTNRIRGQRNPFTYDERRAMIRAVITEELGPAALNRVHIEALPDRPYDLNAWKYQVEMIVRLRTAHMVAPRIAIAGHDKDQTTFYLKLFNWAFEGVAPSTLIDATSVREAYLTPGCDLRTWFPAVLPEATIRFLSSFRDNNAYAELMYDREAILKVQADYGLGPFVSADAIVMIGDYLLTIRRGARPNIGALALPGGFLERGETLLDCAIRETFEETGLDQDGVTADDLRKNLKTSGTFDDPHRSERSRIVTTAFLFELPGDARHAPHVRGSDDAQAANWTYLPSIRSDEMFDDHAWIVDTLRPASAVT